MLWQRISYEAQRIDCGIVAKSPHTLNVLCFHRSGLDSELHCEFEDLQGLKKCRTH